MSARVSAPETPQPNSPQAAGPGELGGSGLEEAGSGYSDGFGDGCEESSSCGSVAHLIDMTGSHGGEHELGSSGLGGSAVHIDGGSASLVLEAQRLEAQRLEAQRLTRADSPHSDSESLGSTSTNPQSKSAGACRRQQRGHDGGGGGGGGGRARRHSPSSYETLHAGKSRLVARLRPSKAHAQQDTVGVITAVKVMAERRLDAILLIDGGGSLSGILTDRDIAYRVVAMGLDPDNTPVSAVMTPEPSCVTPTTGAMVALRTMVDRHFRHLPVAADGKVEALLDITKCLYHAITRIETAYEAHGQRFSHTIGKLERELGSTEPGQLFEDMRKRLFLPTLRDLPSVQQARTVPWVSAMATTRDAASLMLEQRVSAVVVVDETDDIIGIFTTKDLMLRVVARGLDPAATHVTHVMTLYPECVTPGTTILDALHLMHDGRFLHLPIVGESGGVVGLVDALELTYGVVAQMGSVTGMGGGPMMGMGGGGNGAGGLPAPGQSAIWQNFWSSLLAGDGDEGGDLDDDSVSLASVTSSAALTFAFKFEDWHGQRHRFTAACDSRQQLVAIVAKRLGREPASLGLNYLDEEGEECLILNDQDLRDAIDAANANGMSHLPLVLSPAAGSGSGGSGGSSVDGDRGRGGFGAEAASGVSNELLRERVRCLESALRHGGEPTACASAPPAAGTAAARACGAASGSEDGERYQSAAHRAVRFVRGCLGFGHGSTSSGGGGGSAPSALQAVAIGGLVLGAAIFAKRRFGGGGSGDGGAAAGGTASASA
jgi:CBS domain-containing protein